MMPRSCDSISGLLAGLADDELSETEGVRVRAHLDACSICQNRYHQIEAVRRLLQGRRERLREAAPVLLRDRIEAALGARGARWRALTYLGMAAAVLLLTVVGLFHYGWQETPALSIVAETVDDHIRYLLRTEPALDIVTADREEVARWFRGKLDIALTLPDFHAMDLELSGGRVCYLLDRRVAYLMYRQGERKFSLFVLDQTGVRLPAGRGVNVKDRRICLDSYKGYRLAIWEDQGLYYALVSDVPEEQLVALVSGALPG